MSSGDNSVSLIDDNCNGINEIGLLLLLSINILPSPTVFISDRLGSIGFNFNSNLLLYFVVL